MADALRKAIQEIYLDAVRAALPEVVIPQNLRRLDHNRVQIGKDIIDITAEGVYVIALGKAAISMTRCAAEQLGNLLNSGVAVAKDINGAAIHRVEILQGSHPVPDERSLVAGKALIDFATSIPDGATVICLISGGGSALAEDLQTGVSLGNLQKLTEGLLRAGADIYALNAVRARLSRFKAGGLLSALGHCNVYNLIISDVLGDDPAVIASGPTVPRLSAEPAEAVLDRFGIRFELPEVESSVAVGCPQSIVIGNLRSALEAARDSAQRQGYETLMLSDRLTGESREVARTLASIVESTNRGITGFAVPGCLLAGGETSVTVQGNGSGGRNSECALAAALVLEGLDGVAMGFLATDGDDADTGASGAIVTGATICEDNRFAARRALADNDSFSFLADQGAVWSPGASGTNVNDLVIALMGTP